MSYENPQVPHDVNVSRENPWLVLVQLALIFLLVVGTGAAALYYFGSALARWVPFSVEQDWVGEQIVGIDVRMPRDEGGQAADAYVKSLAATLSEAMALEPDMEITAHYVELGVPNASATLGGHIVITSDLYRRVPNENALAMVIAHEIAHIKARDPIAALGGGATLAVVVAWVTGDASGLAAQLANLVQLGYSRNAEAEADEEALLALKRVYGHAGGAAAAFEALAQYSDEQGAEIPSLLSSHPSDAARIERMHQAAVSWRPDLQPLTPLQVPPRPTSV